MNLYYYIAYMVILLKCLTIHGGWDIHMWPDHVFSHVVMSLIVVFTITPHLSLALTTFDQIPGDVCLDEVKAAALYEAQENEKVTKNILYSSSPGTTL